MSLHVRVYERVGQGAISIADMKQLDLHTLAIDCLMSATGIEDKQ